MNEQAAHETKGVTVTLLAAVDLGPEIEGMAGRELRMRLVTIAPGGVFGPVHDHKDRPGIVYILQGTITDHRDGVATDYGPGVGWPEDRNTLHWLEPGIGSRGGDLGRRGEARCSRSGGDEGIFRRYHPQIPPSGQPLRRGRTRLTSSPTSVIVPPTIE